MRRTLYRFRYLVLGVVLAAIVGQIAFGYAAATRQVDVSSGGVADWPQYGRDQEGTRPRWARDQQLPREGSNG